MSADQLTIYTIGHGRHSFADFLALLQKFNIRFVCDVRSFPRSRWPQFNGGVLAELLNDNGIGYEHIPETGGKTVAKPEDLTWGINRIIEIGSDVRTAMMCSESQPLTAHKVPRAHCHRVGLLAPRLKEKGARIIHILPNGESFEIEEETLFSIW
jgi:uncharacterized protein (DUF488 family)